MRVRSRNGLEQSGKSGHFALDERCEAGISVHSVAFPDILQMPMSSEATYESPIGPPSMMNDVFGLWGRTRRVKCTICTSGRGRQSANQVESGEDDWIGVNRHTRGKSAFDPRHPFKWGTGWRAMVRGGKGWRRAAQGGADGWVSSESAEEIQVRSTMHIRRYTDTFVANGFHEYISDSTPGHESNSLKGGSGLHHPGSPGASPDEG